MARALERQRQDHSRPHRSRASTDLASIPKHHVNARHAYTLGPMRRRRVPDELKPVSNRFQLGVAVVLHRRLSFEAGFKPVSNGHNGRRVSRPPD